MKAIYAIALVCITLFASAQDVPSFKFGKITVADLEKKVYSIDSSANAVVLANVGRGEIVGNTKGWFSLEFTELKRIHILNKNGYHNADIEIPVYSSGNADIELENLKAITYNLENGKIVESKLEKSNIFKEKIDKNFSKVKFTLPNVKEGSIIEIQYKVTSDFLRFLRPWSFQDLNAPVLWSDYEVVIPEFLSYAFLSQGYHSFYLNTRKDNNATFTVSDNLTATRTERAELTSSVSRYRWVMKDVPELKKESFTSTLDNHIAKIEFQLSAYKHPLTYQNIMGTWNDLTKELLKSEYFGTGISGANNWLDDDVKAIVGDSKEPIEKARKIYAFVRDNFTCTDHSTVYTDQSLKAALKSKKGNVSEINLLLTAMMRNAGISADPVILSTSDNGYTHELYPLINRFNYVISRIKIGEKMINLDASRPRVGFGKLPADCYNGHARVVNEAATPVSFDPELLNEKKLTAVKIYIKEDGKWTGNFSQYLGENQSYSLRNKLKEKGKDEFFKEVKKGFGMDVDLKDEAIDSLNNYEAPIGMRYSFVVNTGDEDILYINPMMGEGYKENPFKSAERFYPVEMPYTSDETYVMSMEVPNGYVVDELPKQMKVKLDENGDGYFEYLIQKTDNTISMRSHLKLGHATYAPEDYDYLREFFKMVVSKQSEQIVLKKKK